MFFQKQVRFRAGEVFRIEREQVVDEFTGQFHIDPSFSGPFTSITRETAEPYSVRKIF